MTGGGPWRPDNHRALDDASRRVLLQLLRETAGLEFSTDTSFVLERRLQDRLVALSLDSFDDYVRLLRSPAGRAELEHVLDEVTTHETYFFREEYQLRAFRDELLPRLHALAERRRRMTIWSAGCSTGEEVYTVAMLVDASHLFDDWNVRVVGSDLSRRCIERARRGVYGPSSFRSMPRDLLDRYFTLDERQHRVDDSIRAYCAFFQANLLEPERHLGVGRAEAIFCRNVLIYLAEPARRQVLELLFARLEPVEEQLEHLPAGRLG
ncbi:MAG: protein-glutamate O-methyltransferase CheR, partial [Myxococcales bacterium]